MNVTKTTTRKKLVLTDGRWYYWTNHDCILGKRRGDWYSLFREIIDEAYDFSNYLPYYKTKESLQKRIEEEVQYELLPMIGQLIFDKHAKINRKNLSLKWITITKTTTIEDEDFNYENFSE